MSDCRFGVSPVNYPDPDPDSEWSNKSGVATFCCFSQIPTLSTEKSTGAHLTGNMSFSLFI